MRIEAFSRGKAHHAPEANEDSLVIFPGRAFAVVDGATDRTGRRYDGMPSGQYASVVVKSAIERFFSADAASFDPLALISALTSALARAYRKHNVFEAARENPSMRCSATMALVALEEEVAQIVLVGDSGVRLNCSRVLQVEKDLDVITSILRREAWAVITKMVAEPASRERLSRLIAWRGVAHCRDDVFSPLTAKQIAEIRDRAIRENVSRLPDVPLTDIENLVDGGIIHAQGGYQNNALSSLGYSCLDGFEVPLSLVWKEQIPLAELHTIELFSDGYFQPSREFGVDAWEASFRNVEQSDPEKIKSFLSPKGSTHEAFADDRSYIGVRLNREL